MVAASQRRYTNRCFLSRWFKRVSDDEKEPPTFIYGECQERYQNQIKEQNELLVQTVTDVYQAMVKRMQ